MTPMPSGWSMGDELSAYLRIPAGNTVGIGRLFMNGSTIAT